MSGFSFDEPKAPATNRTIRASRCDLCGGDRMVQVDTHPLPPSAWLRRHGIVLSEHAAPGYAPCPDCNPGCQTEFWRVDGTRIVCPDPGATRKLLRSEEHTSELQSPLNL